MKQRALELLESCTQAFGVSSDEGPIRALIAEELGAPIDYDRMGNLYHRQPGKGKDAPVVMVEAHMDEIGFMIRTITPDGYLKFVTLGGWWGHVLLAQRVRIRTRAGDYIIGVISSTPPHQLGPAQKDKVMKIDHMCIDVGATSADDVRERFGIDVGDTAVPDAPFSQLQNPDMLLSKAFDNRVGVSMMIQTAEEMRSRKHSAKLVSVAAVQEELGTRGAQVAGRVLQPDVAIVLEGPPADDLLGMPVAEQQGALGKGPQLRLMDPTAVMNRGLVDFVRDVAKAEDIPLQLAVRNSGGTDARALQVHGRGVPTIVLGVPARYIHTHNAMIHLEDYLQSVRLLIAVLEKLDRKAVESFFTF
ncbi:MAG TPA: glutamyl aminopeptidase [Lentisphaeria bacterium]|jgi:endoglucanase|nr:glutamyl aminopeptidase [Lentisphaeria bacterium]